MSEENQVPTSAQLDGEASNALMDLLSGSEASSEKEEQTSSEEEMHDQEESVTDEESTETDAESASAEEEEEDSSPDDEEEQGESEEEQTRSSLEDDSEFEIEIGGELTTVTGSELKNGYLRHKDYTKKTQEVAQERKAISAEREKVMQSADSFKSQASRKLAEFEDVVQKTGGWQNIRANYAPEQVEQFTQQYVQAQQEAQHADKVLEEQVNEIRQANVKEIQQVFGELKNTYSGFTDATINEMDTYLSDNGFTPDMILGITNKGAWDMMYKSMLYDKAQSRTKSAQVSDQSAKKKSTKVVSAPATKTDKVPSGKRKYDKTMQAARKANKAGDTKAAEKAAGDALLNLLK